MGRYLGLAVMVFFLMAAAAFSAGADDVARITPEELSARLSKGEKIVVVDVRSPGSYERSGVKIRGAVRVSPNDPGRAASEFAPSSPLVFYCT